MKDGKSPGYDGLSVEFYKEYWETIGHLVTASFNEASKYGTLSDSQKTAVLTLIFKKGDREFLKNYRPISLTNADYKI